MPATFGIAETRLSRAWPAPTGPQDDVQNFHDANRSKQVFHNPIDLTTI
jgi:hypothetical protein